VRTQLLYGCAPLSSISSSRHSCFQVGPPTHSRIASPSCLPPLSAPGRPRPPPTWQLRLASPAVLHHSHIAARPASIFLEGHASPPADVAALLASWATHHSPSLPALPPFSLGHPLLLLTWLPFAGELGHPPPPPSLPPRPASIFSRLSSPLSLTWLPCWRAGLPTTPSSLPALPPSAPGCWPLTWQLSGWGKPASNHHLSHGCLAVPPSIAADRGTSIRLLSCELGNPPGSHCSAPRLHALQVTPPAADCAALLASWATHQALIAARPASMLSRSPLLLLTWMPC